MTPVSLYQRIARVAFWLLLMFCFANTYFDILDYPEPGMRSESMTAALDKPGIGTLLGSVVAPVLEESVFRAGLRSPLYSLCWGIAALAFFYYISFDESILPIGAMAVYFTWFIVAWHKDKGKDPGLHAFVNRRFKSYYPWIFWAYAIAFGLMHASNLADGLSINSVLFLVPHTCAALVLGYVRIKNGIWSAIVLHGSINYLLDNFS